MPSGIGVDIIEVDRIARMVETRGEKFLDKIFTADEKKHCLGKKSKYENIAGRFAAKESVIKAVGYSRGKGIRWKDINIKSDSKNGMPYVELNGNIKKFVAEKGIKKIIVSISHSDKYAVAFASAE